MIAVSVKTTVDLDEGIKRTHIDDVLATGDRKSLRVETTVTRAGQAVDLSGASVSGVFVRSRDNMTIPLKGTVEGNRVALTIDDACCDVAGHYSLAATVVLNGQEVTVFWGEGAVLRKGTDTLYDPNDIVPSLDELLALIKPMQEGTAAAVAGAEKANAAADRANASAGKADTATDRANTAAKRAEDAAHGYETNTAPDSLRLGGVLAEKYAKKDELYVMETGEAQQVNAKIKVSGITLIKRSGIAIIQGNFKAGETIAYPEDLFVLPAGFRPHRLFRGIIYDIGGNKTALTLVIEQSGQVRCSGTLSSGDYPSFFAAFPV